MMSMSGAVTCNLPDRSPVRMFVADSVLAGPSLRLREAAAVRGPLAAAPGAGRGAGPGVAHVLAAGSVHWTDSGLYIRQYLWGCETTCSFA